MDSRRLAVVSNRLPVVLGHDDDGNPTVHNGSGGLVTAINPVLRDRGGLWIGWLGRSEEECEQIPSLQQLLEKAGVEIGHDLETVGLSEEEIQKYYYGFSNAILWPLFHDLLSKCRFDPSFWQAYQKVNAKFACKVANLTSDKDFIWIHDYHLFLVGRELNRLGANRSTGFFMHTPFPPLDIFLRLPWRATILHAMLDYDLIGFQTVRDRRNFIQCVRSLVPGARVSGRGQVAAIKTHEHEVRVGVFPISIDFQEFAGLADSQDVAEKAWLIHESHPNRKIMLGVDRLDYTKGIPERLLAFANALERYPELRGQISLIQVVVPSRREVEEYEALKQEIEQLVGQINGQFADMSWTPVHYVFRSLDRTELTAYYRTSEIMLVTPLKDGMNLVAKEYCAASIEDEGVLILSEFAGAAAQMKDGALLVNPHDIEGIADAIHQAFFMDKQERGSRMRRLRESVQRNDIFRWVDSYLRTAIAKDLRDFPPVEQFELPQ
jgi:trehalose 6-phosphate synthase